MKETTQILALGFFDGVHLGHQALLRQCVALAQQMDAQPAAITFDRHPQALFTATPPALINSADDREALLKHFGIRRVLALPVSKAVMSTPWQDFLEQFVIRGAVGFVCGEDFRFGHKGEGNAEKLKAFCDQKGLPCVIVSEKTLDGIRISSTHIRHLLEDGLMEEATRFLGHPHVLTGQVISGRRIGRTIGVPTANIALPEDVLTPKLGVYACMARIGDKAYCAVTNIGNRPTVEGHHVTVEPWILDFEGDLYGSRITLEFHKFLRPEQKFDSLEALRQEIFRNADQTRQLLG